VVKFDDPLQEAAHNLGVSKGVAMAKMVIDHATPPRQAKILIKGYAEDNEKVLDVCPKPLNGGDPTGIIDEIANLANAENLLKAPNIEVAMNSASSVLEIFEEGYKQGFWAEALRRSNEILEANPVD